jgi:hypothetical protein
MLNRRLLMHNAKCCRKNTPAPRRGVLIWNPQPTRYGGSQKTEPPWICQFSRTASKPTPRRNPMSGWRWCCREPHAQASELARSAGGLRRLTDPRPAS